MLIVLQRVLKVLWTGAFPSCRQVVKPSPCALLLDTGATSGNLMQYRPSPIKSVRTIRRSQTIGLAAAPKSTILRIMVSHLRKLPIASEVW